MATTVGSIVAKLMLNIDNFSSNLSKVQSQMEATQKKMEGLGNLGKGIENVGSTLTKSVTLPIVGIGAAAVTASSNFEQAMSKVKAISGATADDMELLNQKAVEMGAKTKFSAKESADAFTYMAMAGWDTKAMLDGIDGIMNLAAADGLDLATTSDIVTDAITAFGLQAKDSAHFADVLAVASSSANTNVSMLGESFKYVAPVAGSLGYSVEDTAVALGLMANSGIKASQAGTSLRAALTNMVKPTDDMAMWMKKLGINITNSDGSMKSLDEVMRILRKTMGNLSQEQQTQAAATIFGKEAMSGMLAIINASDADFEKLTKSINNADGAATEMAETMMDNTAGAIEQMMGSLETLGIQIGNIIAPIIRDIAGKIQEFSDWLGTLDTQTQTMIVTIGALVAAIGPVLIIVGKLLQSIISIRIYGSMLISGLSSFVGLITGTVVPAITSFVTTIGTGLLTAITSVWTFISGTLIPGLISLATTIATSVVTAFTTFVTFITGTVIPGLISLATTIAGAVMTALTTLITFITGTVIPAAISLFTALLPFIPWILAAVAAITAIILIVKNWGVICDWFSEKWNQFTSWLSDLWNGFVSWFLKKANDFISFWKNLWSNIWSAISSIGSKLYNFGKNVISSMVNGVKSVAKNVYNSVKGAWDSAVNYVKGLPSKAITWGKDFMNGMIKGIKSMIGGIVDTVKGIADKIASFLHFTKPDEGPLRPYETWMPDFIYGLTNTLNKNKGKLVNSVKALSENISDTFDPDLSLSRAINALDYDTGKYERIIQKNKSTNRNNEVSDKNDKPKDHSGGTTVNLNIENFYNETDKDIKQLTREVMEVAEEENKRKRGTFGDAETK